MTLAADPHPPADPTRDRRGLARRTGRTTAQTTVRGLVLGVSLLLAATGCAATNADAVAAPTAVAPTAVAPTAAAPTVAAPTAVAPTAAAPTDVATGTGTGTGTPDQDGAAPESATPPEATAGSALAAVAELTVKGRAPRTGYDRDQFGPAWADVDHNGCDTRNDILARDLTDIVTKDGTHDCVVLSGTFHDPYTGTVIAFERGQTTSSKVQIDHVVALSDAWQKGAQQWDPETRRQFGNDPLNLLAADGPANQQKSDGDAATWLPPNKAFRCPYVARQVAVKRAYGLWVTQGERDAMTRVLSECPDEPLPTGGPAVLPAAQAVPAPAAPEPAAPEPAPADGGDVYYQNCTAARAAGAAPLHVGDPGYRPAMDRDNDGVACE